MFPKIPLLSAFALFACLASALDSFSSDYISERGIDVNFYSYTYGDDRFDTDPDFYETGYFSGGQIGSRIGVESINFAINMPATGIIQRNIYSFSISATNFTMSLQGFFRPSQTGIHNFTLQANEGAFLQFGAPGSCCPDAFNTMTLGTIRSEDAVARNSFYLNAEQVYPIKIVYVNRSGPAALIVGYTQPNGQLVREVGSQVFRYEGNCVSTSTRTWTESATQTITVDDPSDTSVFVEITTPTTTVTTYWSGSVTTSTTATGNKGETNTLIIQLPKTITTTTSTWTEFGTSTFTNTGSITDTVVIVVPLITETSSMFIMSDSRAFSSALTAIAGVETSEENIPTSSEHSLSSSTKTYLSSDTNVVSESFEVSDSLILSTHEEVLTQNDLSFTTLTRTTVITTCNATDVGALTTTYNTNYDLASSEDKTVYTTETRTTIVTRCNGINGCEIGTTTYTTIYCPTSSNAETNHIAVTKTQNETAGHVSESSKLASVTATLNHESAGEQVSENTSVVAKVSDAEVNEKVSKSTSSTISLISSSGINAESAASSVVSTVPSGVSIYEGGSPRLSIVAGLISVPLFAMLA